MDDMMIVMVWAKDNNPLAYNAIDLAMKELVSESLLSMMIAWAAMHAPDDIKAHAIKAMNLLLLIGRI